MSVFQPPPTYALPVIVDPTTGQNSFNPIWLNWFLDFAAGASAGGAGSVTSVDLASSALLSFTGGPIVTSGTITVQMGDLLAFATSYG